MRQTVLGTMIGIAVTAVGLGLTRAYLDDVDTMFRPRPAGIQMLAFVPCLAVWSVALLLPSLLSPNRRRLALRPGSAACLAASVGTIAGLGASLMQVFADSHWQHWRIPTNRVLLLAVLEAPFPVGAAVVAVWALLLFAGTWRFEREWREAGGLIVGAFWLVMLLITMFMNLGQL